MIELIKQAKELVKHNKIKKVGGPGTMGQLYEVGENTVRIYSKPGRNIISCNCFHGTKFCNEKPTCYHQLGVILFEADNNFSTKIKKVIKDYEFYKKSNLKVDPIIVLDDLNKLWRAK